jgi:hypothetical protein
VLCAVCCAAVLQATMQATSEDHVPVPAPAAAPAIASADEGEVLMTIYYFGNVIGSCEDYSTITSILSPADDKITIRDIKKSIAYFLRQSKLDREALKSGPVTISSTVVNPLFAAEEAPASASASGGSDGVDSAGSGGGQNASYPGEHSRLPRGMLAVIAMESHVADIVSNIERMNVVVGKEPGALNTLENWVLQDSKKIMDPFFFADPAAPSSGPTAARKGWSGRKIDIILSTGNRMPLSPPRVAITQTTLATDIHQRQYTVYHMLVKQAELEWKITHRYSDFPRLHEALVSQDPTDVGFIPRARIPDLPRKEIGPGSSVDHAVVKKRSVGLQTFVRNLVSCPAALSNIHVLSFFGILSTSRHTVGEKVT